MDETIGVKGGANDRRRRMIISHEQKKKLEEQEEKRETADLEKRVKKKQLYTLIKTLPIVIGGNVVQTIHDTAIGKRPIDKEEENSRWRIKEYSSDVSAVSRQEEEAHKEQRRRKVVTLPTGEKTIVYIEVKDDIPFVPTPLQKESPISHDKKPPIHLPVLEHEYDDIEEKEHNDIVERQRDDTETVVTNFPEMSFFPFIPAMAQESHLDEEIVDVQHFVEHELTEADLSNLSDVAIHKLQQLQSRKIVDEYEKQLKDIRYELRKVIFEYNVLVDQEEDVVLSKDAEILLDRLSDVIDKVEELKSKIKIDNLDQYDDNYIYYLIEGYLKEFRDGKIIKEMEDSPLYVLLSKKLAELEEKQGKFSKSVEEKKEVLEEREQDFEKLKDQYYSLDKFNHQLLEFQYEQDRVLRDIQQKVANATTETERVTQEFVGMNHQSRRLLRLLSFQMFFPGARSARGLAASAAAYLYFMNNIVRPNTRTRKYRVIVVKDYHDEIKDSIEALDDALHLLSKTSDQVDKMMIELEDRYKDYFGVVPEAKELLSNLKRIKRDIEEKEYEMQKLKEQQEKELEKNDAKVKTMGEYPVN